MTDIFRIRGFLPYLLVLFVNAFVDLGHKILIQNTLFKIYNGDQQVMLTALLNALILIPYVLLFSPAGFISDKYPKHQVMRYSAWFALFAVLCITICYYQGWFWGAFAMTFILGIQAAIYAPAKYGYIRELVGNEELANANGMVQAITIIAILGGTFVFSFFFEKFLTNVFISGPSSILLEIAPLGWILVVLTIFEIAGTYFLPKKRNTDLTAQFSAQDYSRGNYLNKNLKIIASKRPIWLSIIGLAVFWAVAQVVLASFPAFAKEVLGEKDTLVIQAMIAATGIGILLGSLFAGKISRHYIEIGLIPIGALGFAVLLGLIPSIHSHQLMALNFVALGFLGGIFIVPLNALIQYHAKENELGIVISGNNWIQNIAMIAFLGITILFAYWKIPVADLFYLLMLVAFIGGIYCVYELPHSLTRMITGFLMQSRYKVQIVGFENLPKSGGALLLGNHISWLDWAMIQIACPRPVRFVMLRSIYEQWYLKPIFKFFGVIPISSGNSKESLQTINDALKKGEVVCLFPEGAISRTGSLGLFHTGFEKVVDGLEGINGEKFDGAKAVIVPFYLHGLWGSRLSRARSEKLRRNTSRGLRREVIVTLGKPLNVNTKADELKQKIFELAFDAWEYQTAQMDPLPLMWLKAAKENPHGVSVSDTNGLTLSNLRFMAATLSFANAMKEIDREKNIGILLPASSAACITNMAALFNGQTAVNINFTTSTPAIQSAINNAQIKTVFTSQKFVDKLKSKGLAVEEMLAGTEIIYLEELKETISKITLLRNLFLARLLPATWLYNLFGKRRKVTDPAAILFSSGSEGNPKGIVLSHQNFIANIKQISDVLKTQHEDVVMGSLPPFHSFGLTVTLLLPLIEGIPVVCHPDPTDVLNIAKAITTQRATILCGTATFLRLYSRNKKVHPLMLDSLRVVVAGAEKLAPDVREEFLTKFNKIIYEGYGATETTPVAAVNIPDQIDTNDWRVQTGSKIGTVGMPLPGCAFRIVDPVSLETLPVGTDGLILISGTQVMLGYLNDPEKTKAAIVELDGKRWYKTGDKGHLDTDGFLTIVDRYSRFAKLGGEMISLGAVEAEIKKIIADEDAEFVAVNIPDEKKGEQIILLINKNIPQEDIRKQMLAQESNPMMIPSQIFVVDAVPKLGSGKTDFGMAKKVAMELAGNN